MSPEGSLRERLALLWNAHATQMEADFPELGPLRRMEVPELADQWAAALAPVQFLSHLDDGFLD